MTQRDLLQQVAQNAVNTIGTPDASDPEQYFHRRDRDSADESDPLLSDDASAKDAEEAEEAEFHADWAGYPWYRKPSVFWLLGPFCLFAMAFGGIAVPKLNIILDLVCRKYFIEMNERNGTHHIMPVVGGDDNEQCQIPEVHARASAFILVMGLVAGMIGAFTSPRLGSLSDRYGRKTLIAFTSSGLFVSEITTIIAVKVDWMDYRVLLLGSLVEGLTGSFMLGMALSYSYGADCTSPRQRAMAFGAFQGCLFLGIAIGPILTGLLIEETGSIIYAFYAALAAHIIFIIYILTLLPESLSQRRMKIARERHHIEQARLGRNASITNPRNLLRPLTILLPRGPGSSPRLRLNLVLLAAIDSVLFGVGMGGMAVVIYYAEKTFRWKNYDSSIYLSVVSSTRVTMLFVVLPLLMTIFRRGMSTKDTHTGADMLDIHLIRFAIIVETIGYICYALAPTGTIFTLAGAVAALGGVGSPTVQSAITKHVPKEKTGQVLGAMALLHSLVRVVAPIIFNTIYALTVGTVPSAVFICLGSTFSVAFVCSWLIKPHVSWREESDGESEGGDEGGE